MIRLQQLRILLRRPACAAVLLLIALFLLWRAIHAGGSAAADASRNRLYICSETRRTFTYSPVAGASAPVVSPYSGRKTGYPAELCYWTVDGRIRSKPTAVLLNRYAGGSGPTFCPECGRLVLPRNPAPQEGHPPPTREQYLATAQPDPD